MKQEISSVLRKYNYIDDAIGEQYHLVANSLGLSDSAFNILYVLYEEGDGCEQSVLYKMTGMNRKTAGSSLQKMQKGGYLLLKKEDTKRTNRVFLTAAGQKLLEEKIGPVVEAENKVYASWNEEDRQRMLSLSGRYLQQITEEFRKIRAAQHG